MIRKNFDDYIKTRFSKKKILAIEKQAKLEKKIFDTWQKEINEMLTNYMKQNNVGFTDLVKILNISPTQIAKIQKGQANLTITSMAHIFATLGQELHLRFKKK